MKRLIGRIRPRSPMPSAAAEGSSAPTCSVGSGTVLASILTVLDIAETAVEGLPIYGPKAVISSIRTVLKSVKQSSDNEGALKQLREQITILQESVLMPLSECTEVPPALKPPINNLEHKVKEATKNCEKKPKRGNLIRPLLADHDAKELQGFANDIKEALQVFKASADVHQMIQQFGESIAKKLSKLPRARGAGYDSGRSNAPDRCFEGTRVVILKNIRDWLDQPISGIPVEPIYWVNGLAGIGKSTIARTVAEDEDHRKCLGASFFFSRQEKDLSDAKFFIPTIVHQLAQSYPEVRSGVVQVLQDDPDIVNKSFATQLQQLILNPLRDITSPKPVLLVVDALDECDNSENAAAKLFKIVVSRCTEVPSLRLLVTSRPETYIQSVFIGEYTTGIVLHENVEQSVVSNDIRRYLRAEMSKIPRELGAKLPSSWPYEKDLDQLVDKAGKLFIWAATAIRFVGDSAERNPASQLKILLGTPVGPNMNDENPYAPLDNLYVAVLSQAIKSLRDPLVKGIQDVIGTIVRLRSEMPLEEIGRFLGENMVEASLGRIQSIVPIPSDSSRPVQIYHPSFPDFITSWERCPHPQFYVDIHSHERRLALRCLDILNSKLSEDVDKLLKPTEEISVLSKEAVLDVMPLEVQYACRFWAVHVASRSIDHGEEELAATLDTFSSTKLLRWVVAMSILGTLSDAVTAMRAIQDWMDKSLPFNYLKERFYDTERMILAYSDIISQCPTQLYYSVLPFLPSDTFLSRQYSGSISILTDREKSWSPLLFRLAKPFHKPSVFFTLDGCTLAVVSHGGLQLYEASSGLLNSSIETPMKRYQREPLQAMFTPDGSQVLVLFVSLLDVPDEPDEPDEEIYGIQYYDLAKQNVRLQLIPLEKHIPNDLIRLSGDGSYIVFPEPETSIHRICIQRIHGGDDASVSIKCNGVVQDLAFAHDSLHLVAVAAGNTITVLDIPSSHVLQTLSHEDVHNILFSPDGLFIASWSRTTEARLFSRTQGTLLATFEAGMRSLAFSCTNHLYMLTRSDNVRVYSASGDHNQAAIRAISLRGYVRQILPAPNDSQIVIQTSANILTAGYGIEVWSLRQFADTHDSTPCPNTILGIDLSGDASRLAISTQMEIEVWDARVGQRCQVFQSQSANPSFRPVAFSPRGELIASSNQDGVIVVDVQAGVLRPMSYLVGIDGVAVNWVGISFDSSRLAAATWRYVLIWDLPSGTLLHTISDGYPTLQWSRLDLCIWLGRCICLDTETFQQDILWEPGDQFREPDYLYRDENEFRIRSSGRRDEPLFFASPSPLKIKEHYWRSDRVCIVSEEGRLLLLDISCLDAYMKEYYHLDSKDDYTDTTNE